MPDDFDQLIVEAAQHVDAGSLPNFLLSYFKEGAPLDVVAEFLNHWSDLLEWEYPHHALALLHEGIRLAHDIRNGERERWYRQRAGLIEGMLRPPSSPRLSFGPRDLIDERFRVYYGCRGGMGEVYFGQDEQEDRVCAAKIALPARAAADDHFYEEATAWLLISGHPNIVEVFFSGNHGTRPYLLMEYIPGHAGCAASLRDRLFRKRPDVREALNWALQFCEGMRWAASRVPGIVHRDIKPENILIDDTGTLKISDWGLVAGPLPETAQGRVTIPGSDEIFEIPAMSHTIPSDARCGTLPYMAPEQFVGKPATARTDVYGFGCVLYEMLTGRPPFQGRSPDDFARAHAQQKPPFADHVSHLVPPSLAAILGKCLAKEPTARFSDFTELQMAMCQVYEQVLGSRWVSPPVPAESSLSVQIERCIGLSKAGKQEAALQAIQRIAQAHPENCFALFTKGNILKELGRHADAIAALQAAVALDGEQPSIWFNLAVLHLITGDEAQGRECVQRAATLNHPKAQELLRIIDSGGGEILIFT